MPRKTQINDTTYSINYGKAQLSQTNYFIQSGKTFINGANYFVDLGKYKWQIYSIGYEKNITYQGLNQMFSSTYLGIYGANNYRYFFESNKYFYAFDSPSEINLPSSAQIQTLDSNYKYYMVGTGWSSVRIALSMRYNEVKGYTRGDGLMFVTCDQGEQLSTVENRGDFTGKYVFSNTPDAYPSNGASGNYWYVRIY